MVKAVCLLGRLSTNYTMSFISLDGWSYGKLAFRNTPVCPIVVGKCDLSLTSCFSSHYLYYWQQIINNNSHIEVVNIKLSLSCCCVQLQSILAEKAETVDFTKVASILRTSSIMLNYVNPQPKSVKSHLLPELCMICRRLTDSGSHAIINTPIQNTE